MKAYMPLTDKVNFKAPLQKGNRVQIPKLIRWRYKLEPWQIIKVSIHCLNVWGLKETYLTKMNRDGRITIPKLTLTLLLGNRPPQERYLMEITLEPS